MVSQLGDKRSLSCLLTGFLLVVDFLHRSAVVGTVLIPDFLEGLLVQIAHCIDSAFSEEAVVSECFPEVCGLGIACSLEDYKPLSFGESDSVEGKECRNDGFKFVHCRRNVMLMKGLEERRMR